MQTIFEPRMGVMWEDESGEYMRYGVITRCNDDSAEVVHVRPLTDGICCYDEGVNYRRDKDNVRLESAPPPFSLLCVMEDVGQCYAIATPGTPDLFMCDEFDKLMVVDDGDKISEEDFDTIFHHPWPEQMEKELVPSRGVQPKPQPKREMAKPISPSFAMLQAMLAREEEEEKEREAGGPEFG